MAIQFHPLPPSVFAGGQKWYIQRLNSELRELFALEGTLKSPRRARRSDLTVTRRGEVQVHVSRISDQAVDSSLVNADTLDGLDSLQFLRSDTSDSYTSGTLTFASGTTVNIADGAAFNFDRSTGTSPFTVDSTTVVANLNADTVDGLGGGQFLRSDASDSGTGKYTLSNATPFDLAGNLVTTIDWGLDSGTLNELHFNNTNPSQTTALYKFLNEEGGTDNFLQFSVQSGQVAFVGGAGSDLTFTAGAAGDIKLESGTTDFTLNASADIDIDAATSMAIDTAAGAMALKSTGGDLSLTAFSGGTDITLAAAQTVTIGAAGTNIDMTAGTDITATATAGDIVLDASGVISIPDTATLDFGTNGAIVFTTDPAVTATWKFDNTDATFAGAITLTVSNFDTGTTSFMKISADSGAAATAPLELECVDDGIWINGAATKAVTINNDKVDCDTVVKGANDVDLIHVDASADKVGISEAAPDSTLEVGGTFHVTGASQLDAGQVVDLETVTGTSATLGDDDYVILVDDDTAGSTVTITLPAAASHTGRVYHIKKLGTTANVIVDGNASETIDGGTTATLNTQYESITIACDGSNWSIL